VDGFADEPAGAIDACVQRGRPFGEGSWAVKTLRRRRFMRRSPQGSGCSGAGWCGQAGPGGVHAPGVKCSLCAAGGGRAREDSGTRSLICIADESI